MILSGSANLLAASADAFQISNYIEAGLWSSIGLCFAIAAMRYRAARTRRYWGAITFILFGLSDVVEAQTGAWYKPFGLLLWKGICLVAIVWLMIVELRASRRK
jgi:hypothetical protein